MAIREIIQPDNPILRQKARRVGNFGKALQELIDDMVETMRAAPGVGLAAPQVAVPLRVIIAEPPEDDEDPLSGKLYILVNPEIVRASKEMEEGVEGCLSIPGWAGLVERHVSVTVKGQDRYGKPWRLKAQGYLARILQHEIDHLDGILFIDRITDPEKVWQVPPPEEEEATTPQGAELVGATGI
ncbi:MAG: peptide deformylase [Chloroflexota bacterium]